MRGITKILQSSRRIDEVCRDTSKILRLPPLPPPSQVKVPLPLFNGRSHCLITVNADPRIKWTEHNAYLIKMDSEKKLFYCNGVGKGY